MGKLKTILHKCTRRTKLQPMCKLIWRAVHKLRSHLIRKPKTRRHKQTRRTRLHLARRAGLRLSHHLPKPSRKMRGRKPKRKSTTKSECRKGTVRHREDPPSTCLFVGMIVPANSLTTIRVSSICTDTPRYMYTFPTQSVF